MSALFVHDHRFIQGDDGEVYSRGSFSYEGWSPYVQAFGSLVVAGRKESLPGGVRDLNGLTRVSGPGVSFVFLPDIKHPLRMVTQRRAAQRVLRREIEAAEALIARSSTLALMAIRIAEEVHTPYAMEVVGCPFDAYWHYGSWQGRLYGPLEAMRTRAAVAKAPFVLYVTEYFLQRRYPTRGVAGACSDVRIAAQDAGVLEARLERISGGSGSVRLGLIGSAEIKYKGVETALEAVRLAKDRLPGVTLHVLGSGSPARLFEIAAEYGVAENVVHDGLVPTQQVARWLDALDIYLQPSLTEGLPRSVVEAMSRGCPVLASDVGGLPELLEPQCLHQAGDPQALAELIVQGAGSQAWQQAQARRNFEAAKRFESALLDEVRRDFWVEFARSTKSTF